MRSVAPSIASAQLRRTASQMSQETPESADEIQRAVRIRFSKVAESPAEEKRFPVGADSAKALGYDAAKIDQLPSAVTESFCGVGDALGLEPVATGQTVLDLGSGAGLDTILAAQQVGPTGEALGVDMTAAMLDKATANAALLGLDNARFLPGQIDALPLADESVDVVISNGVFNLCLHKARVLSEVFRVLRSPGRLQMADILLEEHVTREDVAGKGTWSDRVAGAIWERSLLEMLAEAGFVSPRFHGWTGYRTSAFTQGALVTAQKIS